MKIDITNLPKSYVSESYVFERFKSSYFGKGRTVYGAKLVEKIIRLAEIVYRSRLNGWERRDFGHDNPIIDAICDETIHKTDALWRFCSRNPFTDGQRWFPSKDLVYEAFKIMIKYEGNLT